MVTTLLRRTLARSAALLARTPVARGERGATAVEYALMIGFVAIVIVAAVTVLGRNLSSLFQTAATSF